MSISLWNTTILETGYICLSFCKKQDIKKQNGHLLIVHTSVVAAANAAVGPMRDQLD